MKGREGKGRDGKGREGKGREGKEERSKLLEKRRRRRREGRGGKGREGKERNMRRDLKNQAIEKNEATKVFLTNWEQVRAGWRDAKAREFEKQWIETLPEEVAAALRVIDELDKVLTKARRDCE